MLTRQIAAAPLIASMMAFASGIILLQTSATLSEIFDSGLMFFLVSSVWLLSIIALRFFRARPLSPVFLSLLLLLILASATTAGYSYAGWQATLRMADQLPTAWEGRDILIEGVINDLPSSAAHGTRFTFDVESVLTPDAQVPSNIALTWYTRYFSDAPQPIPELRAGQRWQLQVRLKRPHATLNPGAFYIEAWLLQRNVRAVGYVRTSTLKKAQSTAHLTTEDNAADETSIDINSSTGNINKLLSPFAGRPWDYIQLWRDNIRHRIEDTLHGEPYAGVIVALVVGEQRAIPDDQWQVFNRTGITHLVSISGLHVTLFSTLIGGLLFWCFRRLPRLTSRCPAIKLAVLAGFFASAFYVALAGAGIPAQRTLIMLAIVAIALWAQRTQQPLHTWMCALFAVVLWDPWAPLAAGFWLSFGAVGWLLYAASGRLLSHTPQQPDSTLLRTAWRKLSQALSSATRAQCTVTLGLAPLLLALFQQFSLVSLPANFWAIPWITLGVVPIALLGSIPGLSPLLTLAYELLDILMRGLTWLAHTPLALWQQHGTPTWTIVAALIGIAWLLAPRGFPGRPLGILWCLPMFIITPTVPATSNFDATVLDVGQGLAVFVRTEHHSLIYDTGPSYNDSADAGNRIVVPFLQHQNVHALDALVVSHNDDDHAGGARSLLAALPIHQHYFSAPPETLPDRPPDTPSLLAPPPAAFCTSGTTWDWDGVRFTFLSPLPDERLSVGSPTKNAKAKNDRSCVLKIESPHGSLLLTGDISVRAEKKLLQLDPVALRSNVVIAPHHGSKNASSAPFIAAIDPDVVVYSMGYRNRFGFPRPETVSRYQAQGSEQMQTDQLGAIVFHFDGNGIHSESYRLSHPRYWRLP